MGLFDNPTRIILNGQPYTLPIYPIQASDDPGADADGEVWQHERCGGTTPIGSAHCVDCGINLRAEFNVANGRTEAQQIAAAQGAGVATGTTRALDDGIALLSALLGIT